MKQTKNESKITCKEKHEKITRLNYIFKQQSFFFPERVTCNLED